MTQPDAEFTHILYERPDDGAVAVISLNRGDKANAQNLQLLYDLNNAFHRATLDENVKVIYLRAEGKNFSAGHDLADRSGVVGKAWPVVGQWNNFNPAHTNSDAGLKAPKALMVE